MALITAGMMEGHGWRRVELAETSGMPVLADTPDGLELTEPGFVPLGRGPGKVIAITPSAAKQLGLPTIAKRMRKRGWREAVFITVWRPGLTRT